MTITHALVSHRSCGAGPTPPTLTMQGPPNGIPIPRHVQLVQPGPQYTGTPCQTCSLSIMVCQQVDGLHLMEMPSCFFCYEY